MASTWPPYAARAWGPPSETAAVSDLAVSPPHGLGLALSARRGQRVPLVAASIPDSNKKHTRRSLAMVTHRARRFQSYM